MVLKEQWAGKYNSYISRLDAVYLVLNTIALGDMTLQWRHNGRDGVSNHQPHHCLLNHLFRRR